jgi:hypothetical protein
MNMFIICCKYSCDDLDRFKTNRKPSNKQGKKEITKVKNKELVNIMTIDFTNQDFVIGFCQ